MTCVFFYIGYLFKANVLFNWCSSGNMMHFQMYLIQDQHKIFGSINKHPRFCLIILQILRVSLIWKQWCELYISIGTANIRWNRSDNETTNVSWTGKCRNNADQLMRHICIPISIETLQRANLTSGIEQWVCRRDNPTKPPEQFWSFCTISEETSGFHSSTCSLFSKEKLLNNQQ